MIEVYIKAIKIVGRRLNFWAKVHKMPSVAVSLDWNVNVAHGDVNVTLLFAPRINRR